MRAKHAGAVKAGLVALVPALLIAVTFHIAAAGNVDARVVADWFGTPFTKLALFLAERVAGPNNALGAFISGVGFGIVVFINYWIVIAWLLAGTSFGRTLVHGLLPGPPAFLDLRLHRSGARPIDPFCAGEAFVGREGSMGDLLGWIDSDGGFRWVGIVGPMGVGKTRLALETMQCLRGRKWDVGLLNPGTPASGLSAAGFRRSTCILIDDYEKLGDVLWDILVRLAEGAGHQRVRVIVTDHTEAVLPLQLSDAHKSLLEEGRGPTLSLKPLSDADIEILAPGYSGKERRPLLVKLGANPWIELQRRGAERLARAEARFGADGPRLLAFAALAAPLDSAMARTVAPGATRLSALSTLFEGEPAARLRKSIPPVSPDLLAHEILLQWIADCSDAEVSSLTLAIAARPDASIRTLIAMARERPWLTSGQSEFSTEDARLAAAFETLVRLDQPGWRKAADRRAQAFFDPREAQSSPSERYQDANALLRIWPDLQEARIAMVNALRGLIHMHASHQQREFSRSGKADWGETAKMLRWMHDATRGNCVLIDESSGAYQCASAHAAADLPPDANLEAIVDHFMPAIRGFAENYANPDLPDAFLEDSLIFLSNMIVPIGRDAGFRWTSTADPAAWNNFDETLDVAKIALRRKAPSPTAVDWVASCLKNASVVVRARLLMDSSGADEPTSRLISIIEFLDELIGDYGPSLDRSGALCRAIANGLVASGVLPRDALFQVKRGDWLKRLRKMARENSDDIRILEEVVSAYSRELDNLYVAPFDEARLLRKQIVQFLQDQLDVIDALGSKDDSMDAYLACFEAWNWTVHSLVYRARIDNLASVALLDRGLMRLKDLADDPRFEAEMANSTVSTLSNSIVLLGDFETSRHSSADWHRVQRIAGTMWEIYRRFPAEKELVIRLLTTLASMESAGRGWSGLGGPRATWRKQLKWLGLSHPEIQQVQEILENSFPSFTYQSQIEVLAAGEVVR